jgi:uncharacterized protein YrrD
MLLSETLGERVVSKASAETLGTADGVIVDPGAPRIVAVRIGKGRKARVIPWEALSGVGDAAVVVEHDDALREPGEGREHDQATDAVRVLGGLVLSDRGNEHGTVSDLVFDAASGTVEEIRTSRSARIAGARIRSIGHYAWIVAAADDEVGGL